MTHIHTNEFAEKVVAASLVHERLNYLVIHIKLCADPWLVTTACNNCSSVKNLRASQSGSQNFKLALEKKLYTETPTPAAVGRAGCGLARNDPRSKGTCQRNDGGGMFKPRSKLLGVPCAELSLAHGLTSLLSCSTWWAQLVKCRGPFKHHKTILSAFFFFNL